MNTYVTSDLFSIMYYGNALLRSSRKTDTSAERQLRIKPEIDDVVCHHLDGDTLKEALFIIDNIRENDMKIKWSSINMWSVRYKGKHVCDLRIQNDSLTIGPVNDILATRVKNMSYSQENMKQLIDALRDSITGSPEAIPVLQ